MSRAAVIVWLGFFVAGLTAILGAYLYLHPPDYGLVRQNRAVLDSLPVYPGARVAGETSARYYSGRAGTRRGATTEHRVSPRKRSSAST